MPGLLLWVAAPAGLLALAFGLRAGLIAVCLYAFMLLVLAAGAMTRLWLRPLEVKREVSAETAAIGEHVKAVTRLRNASPWPILWLYVEETLPERMPREGTTRRLVYLPPGRAFHLHSRITPLERGCHQLGPAVMESGDIFGLFKRSRVDARRDFVTALPDYEVLGEFRAGERRRLGDLGAARSLFEDPTRIRGVREYRRGDPMKIIHWKSTARSGQLRSKTFDPVAEAGATIALDFRREAWREARALQMPKAPPEAAISLACSIARYLADGGWKVGLVTNGRDPLGLGGASLAQAKASETLAEALGAAREGEADDRLEPISIRARRSAEQFPLIHEVLGRLALSEGLAIEEALLGEIAHIEREQALVVITGEATEGFIGGMLRARGLGYRMMVYVVCNDAAHDRAMEALVPRGVEVFRYDQEWRAKEVATGRRHY